VWPPDLVLMGGRRNQYFFRSITTCIGKSRPFRNHAGKRQTPALFLPRLMVPVWPPPVDAALLAPQPSGALLVARHERNFVPGRGLASTTYTHFHFVLDFCCTHAATRCDIDRRRENIQIIRQMEASSVEFVGRSGFLKDGG